MQRHRFHKLFSLVIVSVFAWKVALMRKTMQRTIQTAFYGSVFFVLIAVPQLIAHAVDAPVAL
ncbi:MAG: hypothetical protein ACTIJ0_10180 [Glutamicibacter ardleyensis]